MINYEAKDRNIIVKITQILNSVHINVSVIDLAKLFKLILSLKGNQLFISFNFDAK